MTFEDLRFHVGAGEGLVARLGGGALVVPRWSAEQSKVLEELVAVVESGETGAPVSSRLLARRIAGILTTKEPDLVPAFAAFFSADDEGLALLVHGDVEVTITAAGRTETLSGRHVATWVDRVIDEPVDSLHVGPPGGGGPAPPPHFHLRAGVVPAGSLLLTRVPSPAGEAAAAPPPSPAQQPPVPRPPPAAVPPPVATPPVATPPTPPPARSAAATGRTPAVGGVQTPDSQMAPPPEPSPPADAEYRPISLRDDGPSEARGPLPLASDVPAEEPHRPGAVIVEGIACPRGHFNHPDARFCSSCGIGMVQITHNLIEGARPPLGVLLLDDGTTFSLSTDVVIGRAPEGHPAVVAGEAQPLVVDDEERSLSRIHALVELSDWEVRMKDCGSANGTAVQGPGEADWTLLPADVPTTLASGARVRLGKRTFVYDARHRH